MNKWHLGSSGFLPNSLQGFLQNPTIPEPPLPSLLLSEYLGLTPTIKNRITVNHFIQDQHPLLTSIVTKQCEGPGGAIKICRKLWIHMCILLLKNECHLRLTVGNIRCYHRRRDIFGNKHYTQHYHFPNVYCSVIVSKLSWILYLYWQQVPKSSFYNNLKYIIIINTKQL